MTESERIVLNWKARLKELGWPEDAVKKCVAELCEAGYRRCIEDIQARQRRDDDLVKAAIN